MATEDKQLSPDAPVDDVVRDLIQAIHNKGRGFVLGLGGKDGKAEIEVRESLPPHDEWQPRAAYRAHKIEDTDSFVSYALRYGDPQMSLVLYSESGATLSLAEEVERGNRELVTMDFVESDDWREWTAALGKAMNHKALLAFLMAHEHNLSEVEVLKAMQSVRLNSVVNVESDIKDDGKSVGIFVKTSAGDELKRFPKEFRVLVPVLRQDAAGEEQPSGIDVKLDTQLPDDPKSGPSFTLHCSIWRNVKQARVRLEGQRIADGLDGWTVVQGRHVTAR